MNPARLVRSGEVSTYLGDSAHIVMEPNGLILLWQETSSGERRTVRIDRAVLSELLVWIDENVPGALDEVVEGRKPLQCPPKCKKGGYPFGEPPYLTCVLQAEHEGDCTFLYAGKLYNGHDIAQNRRAINLDVEDGI